MAVLNRVYSPFLTQLSLSVKEGALVQDYDVDNKIYTPDRRIRPTMIQPVCSITDPSGILENGVVNRYITDVKWYENRMDDDHLIQSTSTQYKVDTSSNTDSRGHIIVYKNVPFDAPVTLIFTATFVDLVGNKIRRKAYFMDSITLATDSYAGSPLVLKTNMPRGSKYNPLSNLKYMTLSADLYSGNTIIPSAFWWYKKENGQENLITDYVGHNLRELQVPSSSLKIGSLNNYVCKVQDCRQNLTDVRNEHLQEELDKIADYPRNLLAKQYFLDLNDEINPGVVTEGEDAYGKYICIPNPSLLRTYVGGDKFGDLFGGKISFKENTAYVVRIKGKSIGVEGATTTGFMLTIVYTDGKYITYPMSGINTTVEIVRTTESGKTVSHISCTYGNNYPTYIYDIQITEEYNYNLLERDTEEVTIDGGTSNSKAELILISKNLKVGGKYTVSADDIDSTSNSDRAILFQAGNINGSVSNNIYLSRIRKVSTLTVTEKYDVNTPIYLYLYANDAGGSAGNKVTYKNVQLLEGEYAWNVLGEDVEEVTVVGESINSYKSIEIKEPIQAGGKYTLDIGEIIKVEGSTEEYTVQMYQFGAVNSSIATPSGVITQNQKSITFTVNSKYNPELKVHLVLYAGVLNNTSGNTVQYKNIRLLYGETVLPSMPSYTPHFIPSAPDIEVASEAIQLPEGYRPYVQGKTINHEFALTSEMPAYNVKVVTPYGDDSGVISIPNNVKLFPAWIQVDVAGIGTLDNPEKYFSADWGNGLKGMNVLLDADDIGLGVQEVEPDVVEGMEHVKYAASGCALSSNSMTKLEEIVEGSRIVLEIPPNTPNNNAYISTRKNGFGLLMMYNPNGNVSLFIYGYNQRMSTIIKGVESVIQRYELRIGATLEECQLFLNEKPYTGTFGNIGDGGGSAFDIDINSRISLIEYYSPDNVLLHKWDFEGNTDTERLSDKADTENKLGFSKKSEGFELIPV